MSGPPGVPKGEKHWDGELLLLAQAIALAMAWLHAQSAAHTANCVEQPREIQSQQGLTAGSGCQDTSGHPASPGVPLMGGGPPVEPPELLPEVRDGIEPMGDVELPGGAEPGDWPEGAPEGTDEAESPSTAAGPPAPASA